MRGESGGSENVQYHERIFTLPYANAVKSLAWRGDTLVDFAGVSGVYHLDGTIGDRHWSLAYDRFDATAISPSGKYALIYETLGTKGVIIGLEDKAESVKREREVREINRSYCHADVYEYPQLMFILPDGREALAHCPDSYDRLVIEDLETGERIAQSTTKETSDHFYSRLSSNRSGTRLMSTGWFWHPSSMIVLYNVQDIINNPQLLDQDSAILRPPSEIGSAAFIDEVLLVSSARDPIYSEKDSWLPPSSIALYDLANSKSIKSLTLDEPPGTVLPINQHLAISLYEHPKLIDIDEGKIVQRWDTIYSGKQESSIIRADPPRPAMAWDPEHHRLAVATESTIHIIEISTNC